VLPATLFSIRNVTFSFFLLELLCFEEVTRFSACPGESQHLRSSEAGAIETCVKHEEGLRNGRMEGTAASAALVHSKGG